MNTWIDIKNENMPFLQNEDNIIFQFQQNISEDTDKRYIIFDQSTNSFRLTKHKNDATILVVKIVEQHENYTVVRFQIADSKKWLLIDSETITTHTFEKSDFRITFVSNKLLLTSLDNQILNIKGEKMNISVDQNMNNHIIPLVIEQRCKLQPPSNIHITSFQNNIYVTFEKNPNAWFYIINVTQQTPESKPSIQVETKENEATISNLFTGERYTVSIMSAAINNTHETNIKYESSAFSPPHSIVVSSAPGNSNIAAAYSSNTIIPAPNVPIITNIICDNMSLIVSFETSTTSTNQQIETFFQAIATPNSTQLQGQQMSDIQKSIATLTIRNLVNGESYDVKIVAFNMIYGKKSENSISATYTNAVPNAEPMPVILFNSDSSIIPGNENVQIHFQTNGNNHSTTYKILWGTSPNDLLFSKTEKPYNNETNTISTLISPLKNGITYYFQVVAKNSNTYHGESTKSNIVHTTPNVLPIAATNIETEADDSNFIITFVTNKTNLATSYSIVYYDRIDNMIVQKLDEQQNSTIVHGLVNGLQYFVFVRASNSIGHADSETVTVTPIRKNNNLIAIPQIDVQQQRQDTTKQDTVNSNNEISLMKFLLMILVTIILIAIIFQLIRNYYYRQKQ